MFNRKRIKELEEKLKYLGNEVNLMRGDLAATNRMMHGQAYQPAVNYNYSPIPEREAMPGWMDIVEDFKRRNVPVAAQQSGWKLKESKDHVKGN